MLRDAAVIYSLYMNPQDPETARETGTNSADMLANPVCEVGKQMNRINRGRANDSFTSK